ncbi:MAG: type II toxin-antitoxin system prevent-host-death family antitoxin [Candidatus Solibacter sp.]
MKTRVIGATEFKAKCIELLDEVEEHGGTITVTKRGRPIATLSPAKKTKFKSSAGILAGKVKITGDIVNFSMWEEIRRERGVE